MESTYSVQNTESVRGHERYTRDALLLIGFVLVDFFALWWFQGKHIPTNFTGAWHSLDFVVFALVSYIVWYGVLTELFSWVVTFHMVEPREVAPLPGLRVAFLTAFVPGKEPLDLLEKTLTAMVNADYTHDTWLLDEGDDEEAKKICKKLGVHHFTRKGISKYNTVGGPYKSKTKGGNYNSWFDTFGVLYDFVAQLDVDFRPNKDYLTCTLGYFRDPNVAFVGTPQIYGNIKDSWIAKGAAEQAYNFYGSMQKGLSGMGMQLFIGANHIVRTSAHQTIGGYAGHIVEDHLTGMKFYSDKWKSVYVPKILAIGEGPATWGSYFSQQMRWSYGLIDILFTHSPSLFKKMQPRHIINYFVLQQYYFYGLVQMIGIVLLMLYFVFGISAANMNLGELLIFFPAVIVWQQVIFLWLQKFNVDPKSERGLMMRAKLLNMAVWPIYFLALVNVILRRNLNYRVTPKGSAQKVVNNEVTLFYIHLLLGTITASCIVLSFINHHQAPHLLFWAALNTIAMYTFVLSAFFNTGYFSRVYKKFLLKKHFGAKFA